MHQLGSFWSPGLPHPPHLPRGRACVRRAGGRPRCGGPRGVHVVGGRGGAARRPGGRPADAREVTLWAPPGGVTARGGPAGGGTGECGGRGGAPVPEAAARRGCGGPDLPRPRAAEAATASVRGR